MGSSEDPKILDRRAKDPGSIAVQEPLIKNCFWLILNRFWFQRWFKINLISISVFSFVFWAIFHSKLRLTSKQRNSKINGNLYSLYIFSIFNMLQVIWNVIKIYCFASKLIIISLKINQNATRKQDPDRGFILHQCLIEFETFRNKIGFQSISNRKMTYQLQVI